MITLRITAQILIRVNCSSTAIIAEVVHVACINVGALTLMPLSYEFTISFIIACVVHYIQQLFVRH